MAYDEGLAKRVDDVLEEIDPPQLIDKKMFGGIGFMVQGNLACGVYQHSLIVRVGPEKYADALGLPGVKEFDITGRPMTGWVLVDMNFLEMKADLEQWIRQGIDFALTLPPK